jgi:copper chaperone CopZ
MIKLMKTTYLVSGMTCGGCVNRVKTTLASFAETAEVTLEPPQAVLKSPSCDLGALNVELAKVGHYQLTEMTVSSINVPAPALVDTAPNKSWLATYQPLLLVFGYIFLVSICIEMTQGGFVLHRFMPNFMAGFFLIFSFFKLLDLGGFAQSYAMYDVIAKRVLGYGFIYPFIEAGLGAAWILAPSHALTSSITLIVMLVSLIGVVQAVLSRQKIKCACLGAGFNLPMSTVTIIEDSLMAAMAAWMLI